MWNVCLISTDLWVPSAFLLMQFHMLIRYYLIFHKFVLPNQGGKDTFYSLVSFQQVKLYAIPSSLCWSTLNLAGIYFGPINPDILNFFQLDPQILKGQRLLIFFFNKPKKITIHKKDEGSSLHLQYLEISLANTNTY